MILVLQRLLDARQSDAPVQCLSVCLSVHAYLFVQGRSRGGVQGRIPGEESMGGVQGPSPGGESKDAQTPALIDKDSGRVMSMLF